MNQRHTGAQAGVISDTHGYVDPQLAELFRGVICILHAGDIGKPRVLEALATIAPVSAVRGNVDVDPELQALPERLGVSLAGTRIEVVHRLQDRVPGHGTRVVIYGHSHRPAAEVRGNILFLNPGAAGRQGFHSRRTAALLDLGDPPSATLIDLGPKSLRSGVTGKG